MEGIISHGLPGLKSTRKPESGTCPRQDGRDKDVYGVMRGVFCQEPGFSKGWGKLNTRFCSVCPLDGLSGMALAEVMQFFLKQCNMRMRREHGQTN